MFVQLTASFKKRRPTPLGRLFTFLKRPAHSIDVWSNRSYIQQRNTLAQVVKALAVPKALGGAAMTGPALAQLIQAMVAALNAKVTLGVT